MVISYRSDSDGVAIREPLSRMIGVRDGCTLAGTGACAATGSIHAASVIVVKSSFFISSKMCKVYKRFEMINIAKEARIANSMQLCTCFAS